MKLPATAQAEINAVMVEEKITTTLARETPPAAYRVYKLVMGVLQYCDRYQNWIGALNNFAVTERMAEIKI